MSDLCPVYFPCCICMFCCSHDWPFGFWPCILININWIESRSQWPRGLRRRSAASRLLRLWVRFPPEAWMSVCCECCVLSGRGLCDELITRPEESYRLWCVAVCDLEKPQEWGGHSPRLGCKRHKKKLIKIISLFLPSNYCHFRWGVKDSVSPIPLHQPKCQCHNWAPTTK